MTPKNDELGDFTTSPTGLRTVLEKSSRKGRATEPTPGGERTTARSRKSEQAYHGYFRWRRLSRLALSAFGLLAIVFILWMLPWLPRGLDASDYTPELSFTVYLMGGLSLLGILGALFRELAHRDRGTLMLWATVYDEATGLHNRSYLHDRLSLECERARRMHSEFSLLILSIRTGTKSLGSGGDVSQTTLEEMAALINRLTHSSDLVASLSWRELAVVAIGVSRDSREALIERLRGAMVGVLPRLLEDSAGFDVKAGAATYGVDGDDPNELIQAARRSAILALPRPRAAA